MQNMLADALERLLKDNCTTSVLRQINTSNQADDLWNSIESMGFLNILLPESSDGAGATLSDSYYLFELCGKYLVPLSLAETVWARAILDQAGMAIPDGPISLAFHNTANKDSISVDVPYGKIVKHVLLEFDSQLFLLAKSSATDEKNGLFPTDCILTWDAALIRQTASLTNNGDNRVVMAAIAAASIAGIMDAILNMTITYASDRSQFGKPIAKFQAVQHILSQMAEISYAGRMAAMLACSGNDLQFDVYKVAVAKANNSEMSAKMSEFAHAVHGAIGFTEEFDLHLYTSRLHRDRRCAGSEGYWQEFLGDWLVQSGRTEKLLDTVRELTKLG